MDQDGNTSASPSWTLLRQAVDDAKNFLGAVFPLDVPSTLLVGQLKGIIKLKKAPELNHLAQHRLIMWKLSTPLPTGHTSAQKTDFARKIKEIDFPEPDSDDALEGNGIIQFLDPAYEISDYWNESPARKHLHLIVQVPPPPTALSAVTTGQKRKREDEELSIIAKITGRAPSVLANPSEFHNFAKDIIFYNRPFDYTTIPITLLQEEFAQFEDDCSLPPTPEMAMLVHELTGVCCAVYANDNDRRVAVQSVLNRCADLSLDIRSVTPGKTFQTIGQPELSVMPPFYQRVAFSFRHKTRFPCILMTDIGPLVSIYAAIWDGSKSQVQPLHPSLDFTVHYTDEGQRRTIASVVGAMLRAVDRLRIYYEHLPKISAAVPAITHQFPYRSFYTDRDGSSVNICYTSRIREEELAFIASRPEGKQFWRVVTDLSTFIRLDGPVVTPPASHLIIKAKVAEAVKILHDHSFVHGDIRSTNILVDPNSIERQESCKLHIVDFDWTGKAGEATYPLLVNTISVRRPKDVVGEGKILKEHDTAMVQGLFNIG
ncbi:hypothetical protein BD410DRAFT_902194 [Rickenella mellea]|uniref:Protein kinase domain-containing protein n=1 Tax=Rickenella mellea TaxID=50990 RepID=A0A4Y7PL17_9AGAM|nr:hypothetical protein BD410DRAFT_902194 [Rickenella mellea]